MKSADAIQVVIILLLVAFAASCEVAKEYSTRVFKPTSQKRTDSTVTALKFMQFDSENASDSIDLKDFVNKEINETQKTELPKDTTSKPDVAINENKEVVKNQPADATKRGATRNKKVRQ